MAMTSEAKGVRQLLRERAHHKAELERYLRLVTVMFTDIEDSVRFFEQHGDLAGVAMVSEVNGRLQPLVQRHEGTIVKTIGDALLATFENPLQAVRCAIEMQRSIDDYNMQQAEAERVQVRVALNLGVGVLKESDIFGDVVNVCSRIEHLAPGGRICVSPSVVEATRGQVAYRKLTHVLLRGKTDALEIYELVWREPEKAEGRPVKMSGEQLALATGVRPSLGERARAAIAALVRGRGSSTPVPTVAKHKFTLAQVLPDGGLGQRFPLRRASVVVGRAEADIVFAQDQLLSRHHAVFTTLGGALYVEDLGSANGVFIRIRRPYPLDPGDIISLGRQRFRFRLLAREQDPAAAVLPDAKTVLTSTPKKRERNSQQKTGKPEPKSEQTAHGAPPPSRRIPSSLQVKAELVRLLPGGEEENHYPLQRGENTLGRSRATYSFPDDPYLSRSHARLSLHGSRCLLEDLDSTNGTFLRIRQPQVLGHGDTVIVGGQFLRVVVEPGEGRPAASRRGGASG